MGPWLIFAALLNKATIAIYRGSPAEQSFGKFIEEARINILGIDPALVVEWKKSGEMEKYNWSAIKLVHSTGVSSSVEDMLYLMSLIQYRPVIKYRYCHDVGGAYVTNVIVEPIAPCTFNTPVFGLAFVILDAKGAPTLDGSVALIPPSVGLSTEILNRNYHDVYYADMPKSLSGQVLRRQGDHLKRLENGFYSLG